MLNHSVIGPDPDGFFLVVYPTPGCMYALTVVRACRYEDQALMEVDRLNNEQLRREQAIRRDRELRGLAGVYPELEKR